MVVLNTQNKVEGVLTTKVISGLTFKFGETCILPVTPLFPEDLGLKVLPNKLGLNQAFHGTLLDWIMLQHFMQADVLTRQILPPSAK